MDKVKILPTILEHLLDSLHTIIDILHEGLQMSDRIRSDSISEGIERRMISAHREKTRLDESLHLLLMISRSISLEEPRESVDHIF